MQAQKEQIESTAGFLKVNNLVEKFLFADTRHDRNMVLSRMSREQWAIAKKKGKILKLENEIEAIEALGSHR